MLSMRIGGVEQVCDDGREVLFLWLDNLEDVEVGRKEKVQMPFLIPIVVVAGYH